MLVRSAVAVLLVSVVGLCACGSEDAASPPADAVASADGQVDALVGTDSVTGTDSAAATDAVALEDAGTDAAALTDGSAATDVLAVTDAASTDAAATDAVAIADSATEDDAVAPDSDAEAPDSDAVGLYDPATGEVGNKDEIPEFFDKKVIHEIQLAIAPADWAAYLAGVDKPDGQKQCKIWYPADVTVNGVVVGKVGVRCFGNGSQIENPAKPNIRIKFNQFDKLLSGPSGIDNLRLKASGQDPTFLREPMSYNMVRALGGHAPYSGWTKVIVNGTPYGMYQTMMHADSNTMNDLFGNKDGNRYEVASGCGIFDTTLTAPNKQAALWAGDPGDGKEFDAFFSAVMAANPADLLDVFKQHVDIGDWLSVYAVDMTISNIDGLASAGQNFTAYVDTDNLKIRLVQTGADLTFGNFGDSWYSMETPWGYANTWCKDRKDDVYLKMWASPPAKAAYLNKVRHLQCHAFPAIWEQAQTWKALIWPHLQNDPKPLYSATDIEWHFDKLQTYITTRQTWLAQQLGPCP